MVERPGPLDNKKRNRTALGA